MIVFTLTRTMYDGSQYEAAMEMQRQCFVDPMGVTPLPRERAPVAVEHKDSVPVVELRVLRSSGRQNARKLSLLLGHLQGCRRRRHAMFKHADSLLAGKQAVCGPRETMET